MEHLVSINIQSGKSGDTTMARIPLSQALKEAIANAPDEKTDCWLMSNGYNDYLDRYSRNESNFTHIDTILLDVDNPQHNPHLLDEFRDTYSKYKYILWQSASSTAERPKFRAILILDRPVEWVTTTRKLTKEAIKWIFSRWTDDNASWYFTPTRSKVNTIEIHDGIPYPSERIVMEINRLRLTYDLETTNRMVSELIRQQPYEMIDHTIHTEDGWRRLPTVRKCLDGLYVGERDTSLSRACYAMSKHGYSSSISQFLDEVCVDETIKRKFRHKYC